MNYLKTNEMIVKEANNFGVQNLGNAHNLTDVFIGLGIVSVISLGVALYFARKIYDKQRIFSNSRDDYSVNSRTLNRKSTSVPSGYLD